MYETFLTFLSSHFFVTEICSFHLLTPLKHPNELLYIIVIVIYIYIYWKISIKKKYIYIYIYWYNIVYYKRLVNLIFILSYQFPWKSDKKLSTARIEYLLVYHKNCLLCVEYAKYHIMLIWTWTYIVHLKWHVNILYIYIYIYIYKYKWMQKKKYIYMKVFFVE